MRMCRFLRVAILAIALSCALSACRKDPAHSDNAVVRQCRAGVGGVPDCGPPITWDGNLQLQMPIWQGSDFHSGWANSPNGLQLEGKLNVHHLLPWSGTFWVSGVQGIRQRGTVKFDNCVKVGMEYPLGDVVGVGSFAFNTWWDHRTDFDLDRFFVGVNWKFGGSL